MRPAKRQDEKRRHQQIKQELRERGSSLAQIARARLIKVGATVNAIDSFARDYGFDVSFIPTGSQRRCAGPGVGELPKRQVQQQRLAQAVVAGDEVDAPSKFAVERMERRQAARCQAFEDRSHLSHAHPVRAVKDLELHTILFCARAIEWCAGMRAPV